MKGCSGQAKAPFRLCCAEAGDNGADRGWLLCDRDGLGVLKARLAWRCQPGRLVDEGESDLCGRADSERAWGRIEVLNPTALSSCSNFIGMPRACGGRRSDGQRQEAVIMMPLYMARPAFDDLSTVARKR